jgi:5'(3')-deoxyribonucleotidase
LTNLGINWCGIVHSKEKSILKTDVFFDDNLDNIKELTKSLHPRPVVFHQPWNIDTEGRPFERVHGWEELVAYCDKVVANG